MQKILDYRLATAAVETFNQGKKGLERMDKSPDMQRILLEMHRAQTSGPISERDLRKTMEEMEVKEETDGDGG